MESFGAKQGRHARKPPDFFGLLLVEPSRPAGAGAEVAGPVALSEVAGLCCARLLLVVLPALRLPKLRLEPRPMLSESPAVAPLRFVPVGVDSSLFDCEADRGMLRNERFFLGSPSAPIAPSVVFFDAVL